MAQQPRTCLGIDCAGSTCTVVVRRGSTTLAWAATAMRHGQAERLVPMIEAVLAEAGIAPADLDAVGATTGPGGFTGVRIGLATARGYGLALGVPVLGASRFAVVAAAVAPRERELVVAIDTRRDDVALQRFDPAGQAIGEPWMAAPVAAVAALPDTPLAVAGDAAEPVVAALCEADRSAAVVAGTHATDADALGRVLADAADTAPAPLPRPLYLRGADVTPDPAARPPKEPT